MVRESRAISTQQSATTPSSRGTAAAHLARCWTETRVARLGQAFALFYYNDCTRTNASSICVRGSTDRDVVSAEGCRARRGIALHDSCGFRQSRHSDKPADRLDLAATRGVSSARESDTLSAPLETTVSPKEDVMTKASRQVLFSATAVSVCAFALGNLGIVSKHDGILAALAPDGASTVSASALVTAPTVMPLGLPDAKLAKAVLSASLLHHHPQWMDVPMGASMIRTFVIYPDLSGRLPVAVVTDQNEAMSDWARAVGTEVVKEGFITGVP